MSTRRKYNLYWGDFHTHFEDLDKGDAMLRDARENINFCSVLCYPFLHEKKGGLWVESIRQRPEFIQWWEKLQELTHNYYDPGSFPSPFLLYRLTRKWLNRRSQWKVYSWKGFTEYLKHYPLPTPRITHNLYTLSPVR